MANRLKHFRIAAGSTQTAIAKALGVSQPTYQRWEGGAVDIPEAQLLKLAEYLGAPTDALLGRHPPIKARSYDGDAPEELQYYGEVAIHFVSGGEALLLSISEEERHKIIRYLQLESNFLIVKDLGNRTVAIKKTAIADLYLSSEACDDYGPEHFEPGYKIGTPLKLPDPRDWAIIESLACDRVGLEDFAKEDVLRVESALPPTEDEYETLVEDELIKPGELDAEKAAGAALTDRIFSMATSVVYQLSTGRQRAVDVIDCDLHEVFGELVNDNSGALVEETTLILQSEGYHRAVVINPAALDYISIPTHLLEKSSDNVSAALLDTMDSNRKK